MPSLPREDLVARVETEIQQAAKPGPYHVRRLTPPGEIPARIEVTLFDAPAPVIENGALADLFVHRFEMTVTEEYPYVKPAVSWKTPIHHPNFQPPEEGGRACTRLLTGIGFESALVDHFRGIAALLAAPRPDQAFQSPTATAAAARFRKTPYAPPRMD